MDVWQVLRELAAVVRGDEESLVIDEEVRALLHPPLDVLEVRLTEVVPVDAHGFVLVVVPVVAGRSEVGTKVLHEVFVGHGEWAGEAMGPVGRWLKLRS